MDFFNRHLFGARHLEAHVTDRKTIIKHQCLSRKDYLGEQPRIINGLCYPDKGLPFLDPDVLPIVIQFLFGGSLLRCFEVSPLWYCVFLETLDKMWGPLDEDFIRNYSQALQIEYSRTDWSPVHISRSGLRIDRVLIARVKDAYAFNSMRLCYRYSYSSKHNDAQTIPPKDGKREIYECPFQFDISGSTSTRSFWIHKDICRFHGDETRVGGTQNITPVRVGDRIEIAVNLYNAFGQVDPKSLIWMPPIFTRGPRERMCPLEEELTDWYDLDTFQGQSVERLQIPDFFSPQLEHSSTEYAGLDVGVSRTKFTGRQIGIVPQGDRILGSRYEVLPRNSPIILPLKRVGLQHDRFTKIQLREGDTINLYISQGGKVT